CYQAWQALPANLKTPKTDSPPLVWLDVGSGAGLPGLVWACLAPELPFILIEPLQKRAAFLQHAVAPLGLSQVAIWNRRFEEIDSSFLNPWLEKLAQSGIKTTKLNSEPVQLHIVSRGTAAPADLLQLAAHSSVP